MNIQPSIIVWTVICFVLLMLILRNWLFVPVLKVLDARKQRIDSARFKKERREEIAAEYEQERKAQASEAIDAAREQSIKRLEKLTQDGKRRIANAGKQRLKSVNSYREQMKIDHEQIVARVSPEMEKTAEIFADAILSNRV